MLVTFHSKEHSPIIMFGEPAQQLLQMMGFSTQVPGAIFAEDVPQALWQLQQGLADLVEEQPKEPEDGIELPISLRSRAVPLLAMLKAAVKGNHPVYWD